MRMIWPEWRITFSTLFARAMSQPTPLLEAVENVGDHLVKFMRGEGWRMSGIIDFIAPRSIPNIWRMSSSEMHACVPRAESDMRGSTVQGNTLQT
jgi:hypothetical protein